jgi:hypothetical protein
LLSYARHSSLIAFPKAHDHEKCPNHLATQLTTQNNMNLMQCGLRYYNTQKPCISRFSNLGTGSWFWSAHPAETCGLSPTSGTTPYFPFYNSFEQTVCFYMNLLLLIKKSFLKSPRWPSKPPIGTTSSYTLSPRTSRWRQDTKTKVAASLHFHTN